MRKFTASASSEVSAQDVAADYTIDKQIAEEQEKSGEKNLLEPKPEEDDSNTKK